MSRSAVVVAIVVLVVLVATAAVFFLGPPIDQPFTPVRLPSATP